MPSGLSGRFRPPGIGGALAIAAFALLATASAQNEDAETIVVDGRMWSLAVSTGPLPWADADAYCEALDTAGFTDWRLPRLAELESLHEPSSASGLPAPMTLGDCCAWSSQHLGDVEAAPKGVLPEPSGPPEQYYWAYLFDGAVAYYSNGRFDDGSAVCTRDLGEP